MRLRDGVADSYAEYVRANSQDGYSKGVVDYTERWAALLEPHIPVGMPEEQVQALLARDDLGDRTSHEADTEGITGFMYGCAVQALAQFWLHGEGLRRWHNLKVQFRTEGERANASGGVLNPAILTLGDDKGGGK
jgi:hypothetical protein